jgi:hypothetical protein
VPPEIDLHSLWGVLIQISPTSDIGVINLSPVASCYCESMTQMRIMVGDWKPEYDQLPSPFVKATNIIEALLATSAIHLNHFSQSLIKMRLWFIKKLIDLFHGEFSQQNL